MDTAVLDQALNTLAADDLSLATDVEVHDRVMGFLRGRARLEALLYEAVDVWDTRGIWTSDGSRSPVSRIVAETGVAKREASLAVRRARQLRSMPATAAAIRAGRLQPGCVDPLHSARQACPEGFADHEQSLVDACADIGVDESARVIRNWIRARDPDTDDEKARKRHEGRQLAAASTFDGMVHLNGLLPAVGGQEFLAELHRLERQLYLDDQANNSTRTAAQRRADALVKMAERSATLDIDEYHQGRSPRVTLTLVVGLNTAEHLCETLSGVPIPGFGIVPTLERADIERIWFDSADRPLTVSAQRNFTGALRKAIQVRDGRCTHPSICDAPAERSDIDHINEHRNGGPTSIDNSRIGCPPHNRDEDRRNRTPTGWRIWRPPRGWIPGDNGTNAGSDDDEDDER